MDNNGDMDGNGEDDFRGRTGRQYRPVLDNDRAVLEMSSMDPGSSSSSFPDQPASVKYVYSVALYEFSLSSWYVIDGKGKG